MRNRIYLTGEKDCIAFCNRVNGCLGRIELVDGTGRYRVNAKSVLGCLMASAEWSKDGIWIETDPENDYYEQLHEWIADTADDNVSIHN